MPTHDHDDAQDTFLPNARHSIDLSIDLEHQLTYLESQPNTPADGLFASNVPGGALNERKRESLDPHVLASVMFGRGKFQAGVLVEPKREFSFDPADIDLLSQYRNQIW